MNNHNAPKELKSKKDEQPTEFEPNWRDEYWIEHDKNAKLVEEVKQLKAAIYHLTQAMSWEGNQ